MFDVQAKRLHEYKRQLINALHILDALQPHQGRSRLATSTPCTFYLRAPRPRRATTRAKQIIKLINSIGDLVNKRPGGQQQADQVVFLENYCVSAAEIPDSRGGHFSEQISTAGKEASGTGNMKFMMNGAVTIGTMDGANCEIHDAVGDENIYIFGLTAERGGSRAIPYLSRQRDLRDRAAPFARAMEQLIDGTLARRPPSCFSELYHALLFGDGGGMADPYFVLKDLNQYVGVHRRMVQDYTDRDKWLKMAIINTAKSGVFSTDRTIAEYNRFVWHLDKVIL